MPLLDAYDYASQVMLAKMMKPDVQESIRAFIEKPAPKWRPQG